MDYQTEDFIYKSIERWVGLDKPKREIDCPFNNKINFFPFNLIDICEICANLFPNLKERRKTGKSKCPCRHYNCTYVYARVKKYLLEKGDSHNADTKEENGIQI